MQTQTSYSRRGFLRYSAAIGIGSQILRPAKSRAASDHVHIACVGVGGKGASDMMETSVGNHIVAICDVDEDRLAAAAEKFPKAKKYTDWRKLLDQHDIDAVTVSTPDHAHAPITFSAMELGKHVYTQKPLTHSVHEARQLTLAARRTKVVTQMGIQHHSNTFFKTAVAILQSGKIGKVREAHVWTDRPVGFWEQGFDRRPAPKSPPAELHWNNWLGVAPERPYADGYHPFKWRAYWDFGTGALGDMGCHGMDPVVSGLALGAPMAVEATAEGLNEETGPKTSIVTYRFPETRYTDGPLKMVWYDGAVPPPRELFDVPADYQLKPNGILFAGEKGQLIAGYFGHAELFLNGERAESGIDPVGADNHYTQWTDAILGRGKTSCPFDYSGPLTETVLLGNVALRSKEPIEWNSTELRVVGNRQANGLLSRRYRKGWEVAGLTATAPVGR